MITPKELKNKFKADENTILNIDKNRKIISNIIKGKYTRLLVVIGPCSIHNTEEGLEYAKFLLKIQSKYPNLFIIMRTYFEKPRTTIGWKGLINDPNLDGSYDINKGLSIARKFLLDVSKLGIPTSTEFLDNMTSSDISDLISWGAIGARTTESQTHREMSSGLAMPIGFKNSTNGDIQIAIDAIISSKNPHTFIGINNDGKREILNTKGNPDGHIILRGGKGVTNFDESSVNKTIAELEKNQIKTGVMIDSSHANSNKNHKNSLKVITDISNQIKKGNKKIIGVMIESNIKEGAQSFNPGKDNISDLIFGLSITDKCIGLDDSIKALEILNKAVGLRNN